LDGRHHIAQEALQKAIGFQSEVHERDAGREQLIVLRIEGPIEV
jgi:hypothetical protein